jgi:predicted nucleic acid-binding protein
VTTTRKQGEAAKALLLKAEDGEIAVIVPQFVVFEIVYVLQSAYKIVGEKLVGVVRDLGCWTSGRLPSLRSPTPPSLPSPPTSDATPSPPSTKSSPSA